MCVVSLAATDKFVAHLKQCQGPCFFDAGLDSFNSPVACFWLGRWLVELVQELDASFRELAVVQPHVEVLSEADGCLSVENVALQWQVLCQEVVADRGNAVRSADLGCLHVVEGSVSLALGEDSQVAIESRQYRLIQTASVQLHEHANRHVEVVVVAFESDLIGSSHGGGPLVCS